MTKNTNQEKRMKVLLLNMLIVFIVTTLITFCIDGFLLHPIPNQGFGVTFDLAKTDTAYADAKILGADHSGSYYNEIFFVEQDGELHLVYFDRHRMTGRYDLRDDVVVEPDYTGQVNLGSGTTVSTIWFEAGEMVNRSGGSVYASNGGGYLAIGMIVTAVESLILWQILKKKYPVE